MPLACAVAGPQGRGGETSTVCFLAGFVPPCFFHPRLKGLKVASETILSKADDKDESTQGRACVCNWVEGLSVIWSLRSLQPDLQLC